MTFREFAIAILVSSGQDALQLEGLESILVDIHRSDLRLQSGSRKTELGGRTRQSRHAAVRLGQGSGMHEGCFRRRAAISPC